MSVTSYNIPQLIAAVGGDIKYRPEVAYALQRVLRSTNKVEYEVAMKEATELVFGYDNIQTYSKKDYGNVSNALGTPLFQPMTLASEGEQNLFLENAIIDISTTKNIVKTVLDGRDSSVKEFINNGDYSINVSGILCRLGYQYPLDDVIELDRYMRINKTLQVTHEVLNALGVYDIVIESYNLERTPYVNCQAYSFTASSDIPLELKLEDLPMLD